MDNISHRYEYFIHALRYLHVQLQLQLSVTQVGQITINNATMLSRFDYRFTREFCNISLISRCTCINHKLQFYHISEVIADGDTVYFYQLYTDPFDSCVCVIMNIPTRGSLVYIGVLTYPSFYREESGLLEESRVHTEATNGYELCEYN